MRLTLDPPVLVLLATALTLYVRAVRVLRRRGRRVPWWQQAAYYVAVACWAVALVGPIDAWADDLFGAHMGQHLLIADIAAPLVLIGIRWPVLQFLLPRPVLVPLARNRALRRAFRTLRQPLVALPIYVLVLFAWHVPSLYDAALRHPALHAFEHQTFVLAGMLLWWPVLEPQRRRPRGELWKLGYILGARFAGMFMSMGYFAARTPIYDGYYGDRARDYGMSPLADQRLGGGLMFCVDVAIIFIALGYFFWRAAEDTAEADRAAGAGPATGSGRPGAPVA